MSWLVFLACFTVHCCCPSTIIIFMVMMMIGHRARALSERLRALICSLLCACLCAHKAIESGQYTFFVNCHDWWRYRYLKKTRKTVQSKICISILKSYVSDLSCMEILLAQISKNAMQHIADAFHKGL